MKTKSVWQCMPVVTLVDIEDLSDVVAKEINISPRLVKPILKAISYAVVSLVKRYTKSKLKFKDYKTGETLVIQFSKLRYSKITWMSQGKAVVTDRFLDKCPALSISARGTSESVWSIDIPEDKAKEKADRIQEMEDAGFTKENRINFWIKKN